MTRLRTTLARFATAVASPLWLVAGTLADDPKPAGTDAPRRGLTAIQTRDAVRIAAGPLAEARKAAGAPAMFGADPREFVVGVERLAEKANAFKFKDAPTGVAPGNPAPPEADPAGGPPPRAVVISYRYDDDTTVYATVDLATGRTVDISSAQHMRTPLSDGEFEAAKALARDQVEEVRALQARYTGRIETYCQFSQYVPEGEERVHRVVHLLYRVDKRDLSAPRPVVDLTTRTVVVPPPEAEDRNAPVRSTPPKPR